MEKKKIKVGNLFFNDKFVLIFSLITAALFWCVITVTIGPDDTVVIDNVPVSLEKTGSSDDGLGITAFYDQIETVSVTIEGKKYALANLGPNDVVVTARVGTVTSSGKKTLTLSGRVSNTSDSYNVVSITPSYIEVYFDTAAEKEFEVKTDVIFQNENSVAEGYVRNSDQSSIEKVQVKGPTTYVNRINRVVARVQVNETLSATKTFQAEILPLDSDGNIVRDYLDLIYGDDVEPEVTIQILKRKQVNVSAEFLNMPAFDNSGQVSITYSPATVEIAGEEKYVDELTSLSIGTVDFRNLSLNKNTFVFDIVGTSDYIVLDDTENVTVTIDLSGMKESTFSVQKANISIINVPNDKNVEITTTSINNVRVMGYESSIDAMTSDNLSAVIDLSNVTLSLGEQAVDVSIKVNGYNGCWAVGTDYKAYIKVTNK